MSRRQYTSDDLDGLFSVLTLPFRTAAKMGFTKLRAALLHVGSKPAQPQAAPVQPSMPQAVPQAAPVGFAACACDQDGVLGYDELESGRLLYVPRGNPREQQFELRKMVRSSTACVRIWTAPRTDPYRFDFVGTWCFDGRGNLVAGPGAKAPDQFVGATSRFVTPGLPWPLFIRTYAPSARMIRAEIARNR